MTRGTGRIRQSAALLVAGGLVLAGTAVRPAAGASALTVSVDDFRRGGVIPPAYAFCVPAQPGHVAPGPNKSPKISWSSGPAKTASYAIIMVDPDVPTVVDNANKEGKKIPRTLKRRNYYHWALVDIPATVTSLPDGADTGEPSPKKPGPTAHGRRGINDNSVGAKVAGGYDGPCPPWNDMRLHHYRFLVYALNVAHLGVSGNFTGPDALRAMSGHVLAWGEQVGIYTLNPDVAKTIGNKTTGK
jgi:Raf kinase inhibitor-like YbhB/YbcL family protein